MGSQKDSKNPGILFVCFFSAEPHMIAQKKTRPRNGGLLNKPKAAGSSSLQAVGCRGKESGPQNQLLGVFGQKS